MTRFAIILLLIASSSPMAVSAIREAKPPLTAFVGCYRPRGPMRKRQVGGFCSGLSASVPQDFDQLLSPSQDDNDDAVASSSRPQLLFGSSSVHHRRRHQEYDDDHNNRVSASTTDRALSTAAAISAGGVIFAVLAVFFFTTMEDPALPPSTSRGSTAAEVSVTTTINPAPAKVLMVAPSSPTITELSQQQQLQNPPATGTRATVDTAGMDETTWSVDASAGFYFY